MSSRCIAVATYFDGLLDTSTSSTYLPLQCIVADIWNREFSITNHVFFQHFWWKENIASSKIWCPLKMHIVLQAKTMPLQSNPSNSD